MTRTRLTVALAATALLPLLVAGCGGGSASSEGPQVEAVAETSGNTEVMQAIRLGDQYRTSGLPDKAVAEYEKALALEPENLEVYPRLGYALIEGDNYEKAVKIYRRYVQLAPEECDSHASLAYAYLKQDLMDQAIASYEKALELCPEDPNAYTNLGKAYEKADYPIEAIEVYRHAVELNPDDIPTYEQLGDLYFNRKLYPEAIHAYEAILSHASNGKDDAWLTWANYRVGTMYKWAGACQRAADYFQEVVSATGNVSADMKNRSWRGLASCYEDIGETALAIEAYDQVIAANPDKAVYYYRIGELLNDMGRHQEAIDKVKDGMGVDTTGCPAHGHSVIGRAYEKLGGIANYKRAEREFRKAASCGDPRFEQYARDQIERQKQLIKIEELKQKKANLGY